MSLIKKPKNEGLKMRPVISELWDMDDFFSAGLFGEQIPPLNVSETATAKKERPRTIAIA